MSRHQDDTYERINLPPFENFIYEHDCHVPRMRIVLDNQVERVRLGQRDYLNAW